MHHTTQAFLRKRIPCPLDPRHTVRADDLERHLRICNVHKEGERLQTSAWYHRNLHGSAESRETRVEDSRVDVAGLVGRIAAAHRLVEALGLVGESTPGQVELAPLTSSQKHLAQVAAIAKEFWRDTPHHDGSPVICAEFCAGTAQLSAELESWARGRPMSFVLVDKANPRNSFDHCIQAPKIRLKCDIRDLDLGKVSEFEWDQRAVRAVVGKHACGEALDLTLRCIARQGRKSVDRVCIASCCHHRCTRGSFVGHEGLKSFGLEPADFAHVCALTSWGVDQAKPPMPASLPHSEAEGKGLEQEEEHSARVPSQNTGIVARVASAIAPDAGSRRRIGQQCKEILDAARAAFLRDSLGFHSVSVRRAYVPGHVTPENRLITATSAPSGAPPGGVGAFGT